MVGRSGAGIHGNQRHPPFAAGFDARPARIRRIDADAGVKELSLRHLFERRQSTGRTEVEGVVVGKCQSVEADILQRIQHHGRRTAEIGSSSRNS